MPQSLKNPKPRSSLLRIRERWRGLQGRAWRRSRRIEKILRLKFANEYNIVLVLKGHIRLSPLRTANVYINETGNPGMASGGTGDVLTGIIADLSRRALRRFNAAVLGVYFHGLAGDLAVKDKGRFEPYSNRSFK